MNSNEFRKELVKVMPGYKWTVHRQLKLFPVNYLSATGIQTSGFNRLSTLFVLKRQKENGFQYEVKSSGYGLRAPWLAENKDITLARALRGLQNHYEIMGQNYLRHAADLESGRNDEKKASKRI